MVVIWEWTDSWRWRWWVLLVIRVEGLEFGSVL